MWIENIDKQIEVVYNVILCSNEWKKQLIHVIAWMNLSSIVISGKKDIKGKYCII